MDDQKSSSYIDLRGTPCPVNFIRCSLLLEDLSPEESLQIDIDKGEPEEMLIPGLRNKGHTVEVIHDASTWLRLVVVCRAG